VVPALLKAGKKPNEIVDDLFIRALSRKPSDVESRKMLALVSANPGEKNGYDDVLWALVNSTEFEFNH
jgi:hypothetical protein